ncbi:hypothetical protein [Kutzneria kofuensis]|uniref:hypothetical protein n=1 Tax=Kutzneria kofuensis TaxID=103725 RepID=UPI0031EE4FAB
MPTTAFTHRRYWLLPDPATDVSRLGLDSVHHPILGAALPDPKGRGVVLSGTVSRASDLTAHCSRSWRRARASTSAARWCTNLP